MKNSANTLVFHANTAFVGSRVIADVGRDRNKGQPKVKGIIIAAAASSKRLARTRRAHTYARAYRSLNQIILRATRDGFMGTRVFAFSQRGINSIERFFGVCG